MRAMIVAAGLGTRLRPLTHLLPKPAVPVRGIPMIAYPLRLLAAHGVREVIINVHALADRLIAAAEAECPPGLRLVFSHEPALLGTGGGIRRATAFLRESDPCVILGGDMILDVDLAGLVARHRTRGDAVTMLLRDDPRGEEFGTLGVDAEGSVRRIGRRFDLGAETACGAYVWANVIAARAFDALPNEDVFSHLDAWFAPMLRAGARDVRAEVAAPEDVRWDPVGTPAEYLAANFRPMRLSFFDADAEARRRGVVLTSDRVVGVGAQIGTAARLDRVVVWDGETVPPGMRAAEGVFAGGRFHSCRAASDEASA